MTGIPNLTLTRDLTSIELAPNWQLSPLPPAREGQGKSAYLNVQPVIEGTQEGAGLACTQLIHVRQSIKIVRVNQAPRLSSMGKWGLIPRLTSIDSIRPRFNFFSLCLSLFSSCICALSRPDISEVNKTIDFSH